MHPLNVFDFSITAVVAAHAGACDVWHGALGPLRWSCRIPRGPTVNLGRFSPKAIVFS